MNMFPDVAKLYNPKVNKVLHSDLQRFGEYKADTLLGQHNECFDSFIGIKNKSGVALYETSSRFQGKYTVRATCNAYCALSSIVQTFCYDSSSAFRSFMRNMFGKYFIDGTNLYKANNHSTNKYVRINWLAMSSQKRNSPHKDYVVLDYGKPYEIVPSHKILQQSLPAQKSKKKGMVFSWEAIKIDGCEPFEDLAFVQRSELRNCGFVIEEVTDRYVAISFYISSHCNYQDHTPKQVASEKKWMRKIAFQLKNLELWIHANLPSTSPLPFQCNTVPKGFNLCNVCYKSFSCFSRKRKCNFCEATVCSSCSTIKKFVRSENRQLYVQEKQRICGVCYYDLKLQTNFFESSKEILILHSQSFLSNNTASTSSITSLNKKVNKNDRSHDVIDLLSMQRPIAQMHNINSHHIQNFSLRSTINLYEEETDEEEITNDMDFSKITRFDVEL